MVASPHPAPSHSISLHVTPFHSIPSLQAAEKIASRINPGLGNPYEKKKLMETLRSDKRVTTGDQVAQDSKTNYTSSTKFFKELQEEKDVAKGGGKAKKKAAGAKKKKGTTGAVGNLKL